MVVLDKLGKDMHKTHHQTNLTYDEFLFLAAQKPDMVFRDIFQLYNDMIHHYVPEGFDEYPVTKDSAGFLNYDMKKMFVEHCSEPFYADRIFANRFMSMGTALKKGVQNNQIYLFEGPPGSGKSTFLNNLLKKIEDYTRLPDGAAFKIAWELHFAELPGFIIPSGFSEQSTENQPEEQKLLISCPNNDHPITIFPKELRKKLLEGLIADKKILNELFTKKEYEWVFNMNACAFCSSMYNHLIDIYKSPLEVIRMVKARRMEFSRHFGKGVSIFNPGDPLVSGAIENKELQQNINRLFSSDEIPYLHSYLAYTNNGVLALMDIKGNNVTRLMNLHGIISDGVHKVSHLEERIRSLFIGVINPEDKSAYENVQSFKDRIITIKIPYVLDYNTEVSIWRHKFGNKVIDAFMPRTLANFSKIIISTRMLTNTLVYDQWLEKSEKYKNYIDDNLLLLKMELYTGKIPRWLDEKDISNFKKDIRKNIILETEKEGNSGVSGRQSLHLFNKFISGLELREQSIDMQAIVNFVRNEPTLFSSVPAKFIDALFNLYEYNILDEVKDSLFFYNEVNMKRDIKNYLFALNFEYGEKIRSHYTGDTIELNDDFFNSVEPFLYGDTIDENTILQQRKQEHLTYVTQTLSDEIQQKEKNIEQTEQFLILLAKYADNLKKSSLLPYENNEHFKRCVEAFNTPAFNKFELPLKKTVNRLVDNMCRKFGYHEQSAQYIILYVLENRLNERFRNFGLL